MAEVLALLTSVVGLVQAVELTRKSLGAVCDLKNAPAEAKRVSDELQQINAVAQGVEKHVRSSQSPITSEPARILHSHVSALKSDLEVFRTLIEPHQVQDTGWARLKIRMKWATGLDKRLGQISSRLTAHVGRLQLAVSLYSSDESRTSSQQIQHQLSGLTRSQETEPVSHSSTDVAQAAVMSLNRAPRPAQSSPSRPASITHQLLGTTFVHGSPRLCADLLIEVSPTISKLFNDKGSLVTLTSQADWVRSQLFELLHDIYAGQVKESSVSTRLPEPPPAEKADRSAVSPRRQHAISRNTKFDPLAGMTVLFFLKISSLVDATSVEHAGDQQTLYLDSSKYQTPASSGNGIPDSFAQCRLFVISTLNSTTPTAGAIVQFSELSGTKHQLWRTLITFGVHPASSQVFQHIRNKDLAAIKRMLSLRLISPNDRDEDGNSLLWHCLSDHTNYDMCELLLREKADPSDCTRRGDHALAVVVMHMSLRGQQIPAGLKLVDLLLRFCHGKEAYGMLQYKRRKGVDHAPASILHCAFPRHQSGFVAQLPTLLGRFIQSGVDLEMTDKNGNSALLYSLFYHPVLVLTETATFLLEAGADVLAKNKYGEGCLHLIFRRLSACSIPNLSRAVKARIVDFVVRLIGAGCDPVEGNVVGYTPIDAAMSPVGWPLLCVALEKVGRSIDGELRLLDFAASISLSDAEMEEKCRDPMTLVAPQRGYYPSRIEDRGIVCYLCGRGPDVSFRDPPFDEFYSDVVDELGHGIHMIKHLHENKEECLHINEEDSCHNLDYHPAEMIGMRLEGRSIRRYVAASLWKRGLLD
ncbi:ankyrin repeat-containing domain protein [Podospora didyma]|uniref:Ankyrin repeat-containing domain protein n=1 Tax=Podospora didyma TaxID=330526 RepID=A0AAE0KF14_9PEZI|nr:ankyrin repeat-containing domain protein [Podospora didyma]